jgi:hypothetical protein
MKLNRKHYVKLGANAFVAQQGDAMSPKGNSWQAKAFADGFNDCRYQYLQLIATYSDYKAMRDAYWVVTGEYHTDYPMVKSDAQPTIISTVCNGTHRAEVYSNGRVDGFEKTSDVSWDLYFMQHFETVEQAIAYVNAEFDLHNPDTDSTITL